MVSIQSRREVSGTLVLRYRHASRVEKGRMLDEPAAAAGFEMGTGIYITTAIPEETAAYLREQAKAAAAA